ncbi:MAG: PKD domain-containing protein [Bacteroidota bacterium]
MIKTLRLPLIIILIFICLFTRSQYQVIHDIPWHSDTVGMWGSGSSAWSINEIDTLVDLTIGPYGDTYSYVYTLPWPIDDSVGVIFDYGMYLDMQMVFEMTGWDGGSVYTNYPTKITMDFPAPGTFSNGDWITIPSEYREQDTSVYTQDWDKWDIYADWPTAGKIELYVNMDVQANIDLIYSNPTDPFNITWDTIHIIDPVNIDLDTFDIFLIDVPNAEYVIPWVAYHTDPFTGNVVIDSVYFLHDSLGWPIQFPAIFYDLIGITGSISIPEITSYTKWISNEQRLYAQGSDQYLYIDLDLVKFLQVMCHYLSSIPSLEGLEAVSQALEYEEGDTSIYIFTDPLSGEDFTADLAWDLIDANLLFTNTMNQTLSFEDIKEYTIFGIPIPPDHYPNVWNVFDFPVAVDYNVLDTTAAVIESGSSNSITFGSDYDLQLRYPCYNYDSLPVTITHTIDPWLTNLVQDSIDVDFYLKVLEISYSIGTQSDPIISGYFLLYEDTMYLGTFAGPPLFGPPLWMPWEMDGYFPDTTFVPDENIFPSNNPLDDSIIVTQVLCYGTNTGSATVIAFGGVPPYQYVWSTGATSATINNLGVGTYNVTVTDDNGCIVVDSVTLINLNPPISTSHTSTDVLCHGDNTGTATLSVTGGTPPYQYTWSPNAGNGPAIINLYAGAYYVSVVDNVGCIALDTIIIDEPDSALLITIQNITNIICNGQDGGAAIISVSGGTAPYSYQWSNGSISQNLNNVYAGTYYLTVTDANNCLLYDTVDITQPDQLMVYAHDYTICLGQTIAIAVDSASGGTPPYTYNWNTGATGQSIIVSPVSNTTYTVYALDVNGCPGVPSTITVGVTQALNMNLFTYEDSICYGESASIYANITGGGGPPYVIFLNNGMSGMPPLTVNPTQSTTYVATVWDTCNFNSYQDTITITVLPLPNVNFTAGPQEGCQPLTVNFTDMSGEINAMYSWNFGDGTSGIILQNPTHTYNEDGLYTVMFNVTSQYGCKSAMTVTDFINVWPKPFASFYENVNTISILDPVIYFNNTSSTTYSSYWNFGDGGTSTATDPWHKFTMIDTFTVMLVITSDHGCLDTAYDDIYIKDILTLYIPNAFTPDDNGINEVFMPYGNEIDPEHYQMMIFNRWGEMVFKTDNLQIGWDGKVNGSSVISDAVFSYVIIYTDRNGLSQKKIGSLTLLHNAAY